MHPALLHSYFVNMVRKPLSPDEKSVEIPVPLMNSLTILLDFSNAEMEPIRRNLLRMSDGLSLNMANGNNKIMATNICTNSKDRKLLTQLLKNPEVFLFNRQMNANGEKSTRTLTIMYLIAKVMIKLIEEIESIPDKIPSMEKILKLLLELPLISFIKDDNEIVLPKIFVPKSHIKLDIS